MESLLSEVWKSNSLVGEEAAGAQCRLTTCSGSPEETDASPADEVAIGGAENPACEDGVSMAAMRCSVVFLRLITCVVFGMVDEYKDATRKRSCIGSHS